ncbi:hypothetical protein MMC25_002700 [Agyrium rufum]|nr:hypothetical protein [Agyrium rufum]
MAAIIEIPWWNSYRRLSTVLCSECRRPYTLKRMRPRPYSTATTSATKEPLTLNGKTYERDDWTNVPESILSALPRKLHVQPSHPISLTRKLITSHFPKPTYAHHSTFSPIATTHQNFDSLDFPPDHPGRSKTDTYYLNADTVLRTHTSAHQVDTFRANESEGYTISADVYRRDAIDRSHYPVFHQMEGARLWDRTKVPGGNIAKAVWADLETLPKHNLIVEDPNPPTHPERNPLQEGHHSQEEAEAIAAHLKRSLESVVVTIFARAKEAAIAAGDEAAKTEAPLRVRWIEAYFPFTSPSWEMEVFWQGDWLEILGCGVVKQSLLERAEVPQKLGWAFGIGLERIAMLLYSIPDIRLFWSNDQRFLSQFKEGEPMRRFVPFSKYPECYKDVSFWVAGSTSSAAGGAAGGTGPGNAQREFHENDFMEVVREVAGDTAEHVRLVDEFTHPVSGRKSRCYRVTYRSLEKTLRSAEANELHKKVEDILTERLGVEIR